jgi:hypothetical protein
VFESSTTWQQVIFGEEADHYFVVHHENAGTASSLVLPSAHSFGIILIAKIVQIVGWINILCVFA